MEAIGTFERNVKGRFIYKRSDDYVVFRAQGMVELGSFPRGVNIWQSQLIIWIWARGW